MLRRSHSEDLVSQNSLRQVHFYAEGQHDHERASLQSQVQFNWKSFSSELLQWRRRESRDKDFQVDQWDIVPVAEDAELKSDD